MQFSKSRFGLSVCVLLLCCCAALGVLAPDTVRAEALPATSGSYTDLGGGVIKDNLTGLMWQQATAPGTYTWQQALEYCTNLSLGGYDDWRLPAVKELGNSCLWRRPQVGPEHQYHLFPRHSGVLLLVVYTVCKRCKLQPGACFLWAAASSAAKRLSTSMCARCVRHSMGH